MKLGQARLDEDKIKTALFKRTSDTMLIRAGLIAFEDDPVVSAELRARLLELIRSNDFDSDDEA